MKLTTSDRYRSSSGMTAEAMCPEAPVTNTRMARISLVAPPWRRS